MAITMSEAYELASTHRRAVAQAAEALAGARVDLADLFKAATLYAGGGESGATEMAGIAGRCSINVVNQLRAAEKELLDMQGTIKAMADAVAESDTKRAEQRRGLTV